MKHVVITGADGFIGSHLTKYFIAHSYFVYAIVSPMSQTTHRIQNLEHVCVIAEDLNNYTAISKKVPDSPVAFFHLAWAGVSPEERQSTIFQSENISLSLYAVQLAHLLHAKRFIFPGSTLEYSYCGQLINDSARPSPQNAYGATKISARYLCESLCHELDVPYIYVVITGIYGADRIDNNVITYTIRSLLLHKKPQYTKLEQLWDYIHIDDLTDALLYIAQKGKAGSFYSVGHGDNWPLRNYIEVIHNLIDPSLPIGIGEIPYTSDIIPSSCIDLTALRNDTGFSPRIPFEYGIKGVIDTMRKQIKECKEN